MKIIEAMNELKLINKKLQTLGQFLRKYSARTSVDAEAFKNQGEEVSKRLQAAKDLIQRYRELKARIDYTNMKTEVTIAEEKRTIADLLIYKRLLMSRERDVLMSLDDNEAKNEVRRLQMSGNKDIKVNIVYHYDIQKQSEDLEKIDTIDSEIDSRLQISNTVTDLLELPS